MQPQPLSPDIEAAVAEQDANMANATLAVWDEQRPSFDRAVRSRDYNVTLEMLERTIEQLSGGQVTPAFPRAQGKTVHEVDAKVWAALVAIEQFAREDKASGLKIDAGKAAAKGEAFADLAGVLSEWRRATTSADTGTATDAGGDPSAVTAHESAVGLSRADAAGIAAGIDAARRR